MKRVFSVFLALLTVISIVSFSSCAIVERFMGGGLSGTYENVADDIGLGSEVGSSYTFSGNTFTYRSYLGEFEISTYSGNYKIKGDVITFSNSSGFYGAVFDQSTGKYFRNYSFSEGPDYIVIDGTTYYKK
ncbi:MAG: hypothetical protein IKA51_06295 [Clostridia bacterium]|nr:hypothetical protein [Clostridia bacterium]